MALPLLPPVFDLVDDFAGIGAEAVAALVIERVAIRGGGAVEAARLAAFVFGSGG